MKNLFIKLRLLFIPFVICTLGLLITYTLFHWCFAIQLNWIRLDPVYIELLFPAVGASLLVYLVMRPRIIKLYFKKENGIHFLYFVTGLSIAIPLIIAQMYLSIATGEITELKDITEIDSLPTTKYYRLKNYYLYNDAVGSYVEISKSGKFNRELNFNLYCVQPILVRVKDTAQNATHYWFCVEYYKQISNRKTDEEKKKLFSAFMSSSKNEFDNSTFNFSYLERISYSSDAKNYGRAASRSFLNRDGEDILLIPHEGKFEDRTGARFGWIFKSMGIVSLVFILSLLFFRLKTPSELNSDTKREERLKRINKDFFIPKDGYYITPLLLYANLVMFLLLFLYGAGFFKLDNHLLHDFGGLSRWAVKRGDVWRILSSLFLHGGFIHLLATMLGLFYIGLYLEPLLGRWRFLIIYLLCGIGSSIMSILLHESTLNVGASGAVFGLYGLLFVPLLLKFLEKPKGNLLWIAFVIFTLVSIFLGFSNGVVTIASLIGGLVTGFSIGALLCDRIEAKK